VEPQTPAARAQWLEHTVEGLAHEVASIRAQLGALMLRPPAPTDADRALADLLVEQLRLMERQCALVRAELARLRAALADDAAPPAIPAPDRAPPPDREPPEAPDEG
jgi:hypothetical protein